MMGVCVAGSMRACYAACCWASFLAHSHSMLTQASLCFSADGKSVIDHLDKCDVLPDLMLLDIMMPGGYMGFAENTL